MTVNGKRKTSALQVCLNTSYVSIDENSVKPKNKRTLSLESLESFNPYCKWQINKRKRRIGITDDLQRVLCFRINRSLLFVCLQSVCGPDVRRNVIFVDFPAILICLSLRSFVSFAIHSMPFRRKSFPIFCSHSSI